MGDLLDAYCDDVQRVKGEVCSRELFSLESGQKFMPPVLIGG